MTISEKIKKGINKINDMGNSEFLLRFSSGNIDKEAQLLRGELNDDKKSNDSNKDSADDIKDDSDKETQSKTSNTENENDNDKETESTDNTDENEDDTDKHNDDHNDKEDGKEDYKTLYQQIMSPFKANGKSYTPRTVEEARRLMQMGSGYNKKSQELNKQKRIIDSLIKAGIKSDDDINHLIDIFNGDEAAIKKLIEKNNIDIIQVNESDGSVYKPGKNMESEESQKVFSVFDDLKVRDSWDKVQNILENIDNESSARLYENPSLIKDIADHVDKGWFDVVQSELDRNNVFGQTSDIPFLDAYREMGEKLMKAGKLPGVSTPKKANSPSKNEQASVKKSASIPKGGSASKRSKYTVNDVNKMDLKQLNNFINSAR